jgi:2-polyprenyl-3-methyl-5-hydroxy-6-metoxy-1,4-benzoquinol methylase
MIDEARKLHGEHHFEVCDMLSVKSLNHTGTFDAIILLASFHHLETREARIQVLWDIQKFLSPNGSVYMTNWNLREQPRYKKSHRGNGDFDIKIGEFSRYYHGFTTEELSELFRETGWSIIENRIFE